MDRGIIMEKKPTRNKILVAVIATIAATGGLLFGFDTGVISGAIPYFQKNFALDNDWVELITTAGLAGAVFGAISSGRITDIIGRKKVIMASAFLFLISLTWLSPFPRVLPVIRIAGARCFMLVLFLLPLCWWVWYFCRRRRAG